MLPNFLGGYTNGGISEILIQEIRRFTSFSFPEYLRVVNAPKSLATPLFGSLPEIWTYTIAYFGNVLVPFASERRLTEKPA